MNSFSLRFLRLALVFALLPFTASAAYRVGAAAVNITPDYPVRLSGFGFRRAESEGVTQKIWAKALAIDDGKNGAAVIITVDNLGIPESMTRAVAAHLQKKTGLKPGRLAIMATHTHTAPMLTDVAPTLFSLPIPAEHQKRIDRYTAQLTDWLEKAALDALKDLQPGKLEWGIGTVGFAKNRRAKGGPIDHDLPLLVARTADGKIRAIYVSYACHCVTLSNNKISGDWAGYAQAHLQKDHPGAVALVGVGCGADQNPKSGVTGDNTKVCSAQGKQIADEVKRLLAAGLNGLNAPLTTRGGRINLPFGQLPTKAEWEVKAKLKGARGYHARVQLARLARGEKLQAQLDYPVQTWAFGDQLAMVFLPGEVVVDYAVRLKREFDRMRLFVHAYANDAPCYIPSERILNEGGYEAEGAMIYYDRPTRLAVGIEAKIMAEVHRQLPKAFRAQKGCEGTAPRSPEASRLAIAVPDGLRVELVAAEPLVIDPVAIDWGPDGQLWVIEMHDYPSGLDGKWKPGGRVVKLSDKNGDGKMDHRQVFLDGLPFPTGLMAWREGVLVCAAPHILFARDTTGDGRADKVEKLFSGFETTNYQARVNGLHWGLDNWIHAANGLLGGQIKNPKAKAPLDIRGHDFRFQVGTGKLERLSGLSQQGRVRDDWGNPFGCTNGQLAWHYPLPARYARRNPHVTLPNPRVAVADGSFARLYPRSRLLARFNNSESANRVTSACGIAVYRDELLGKKYAGDLFVCEPVHNLVVQLDLKPKGVTFTASRAHGQREFLASTDNWFRPAQVRTGPDGALWVVDMYRYLIEHPRWVAHDRLANIDPRAGSNHGRIYRIVPTDKPLRKILAVKKMSVKNLASLLESPNGPVRDLAHRKLLRRPVQSLFTMEFLPFWKLLRSDQPKARIHVLSVVDGFNSMLKTRISPSYPVGDPVFLIDTSPAVRRHCLGVSENLLNGARGDLYPDRALRLVDDKSLAVRYQLALTLGEWENPRAGKALAVLAMKDGGDAWMRAAILSSAVPHARVVLAVVLKNGGGLLVEPLLATVVGTLPKEELGQLKFAMDLAEAKQPVAQQLRWLATLDDGLRRRGIALAAARSSDDALVQARAKFILRPAIEALRLAADLKQPEATRVAAIALLGRGFHEAAAERQVLVKLLGGKPTIRRAALERLLKTSAPEVAGVMLADWPRHGPGLRAGILNALLARPDWTEKLLQQMAAGKVAPNELSLAQRDRLRRHPQKSLRDQAARLFKAPAARAAVLKKYVALDGKGGDAAKGAVLFRQACAICHQFRGQGSAVGPRLDAFHTKPAGDYLKAILDPNAVVEPNFIQYQVQLKDGRELAGVVQSETATGLTLALPTGLRQVILKRDIKKLNVAKLSLMPEGLEQVLPPEKMADLLAYLRSAP
jgi:putative membrane-bound dehydrogenase-like protein